MLLVMRTVSLLQMTFKPAQWTAPLSRELLVFNAFVKSTSRAMRNLVEMISMSLLLRGDARRNRDDYLDISLSLPFQTDVKHRHGYPCQVLPRRSAHVPWWVPCCRTRWTMQRW